MSTDAEISTRRQRSSMSASPTGPSLDTTVRLAPSSVCSCWPTIPASVVESYLCVLAKSSRRQRVRRYSTGKPLLT